MDPRRDRIARSLAAGALGAAKWLAAFGVVFVLGVVVAQSALLWRETGTLALLPTMAGANQATDVVAVGATDGEAAAIRGAVAGLAYRLPLRALAFTSTDEPCEDCRGAYVQRIDTVRIQRGTVRQDGPVLQHAVAHEIGHYIDENYMTDALRADFKRLRGIPAADSWYAGNKRWEDRPAEDFAEVFAMLNLTTADGPVGTSYGPIRNPAAFVALMNSAGISLSRPATPPGWRLVLAREIAFAKYLTSDWKMRLSLWALVVLYAACGAIPAARKAWRASRG